MSESGWRRQLAPHDVTFAAPASAAALGALERRLGLALPPELRGFLAESNGLADRYKTEVLWPVAEIARQNKEFRTRPDFRDLYMPFDAMLFFGAAGNGDQFFYRILGGAVRDAAIHLWDHETDSRTWRAPNLGRFLAEILVASPDE